MKREKKGKRKLGGRYRKKSIPRAFRPRLGYHCDGLGEGDCLVARADAGHQKPLVLVDNIGGEQLLMN